MRRTLIALLLAAALPAFAQQRPALEPIPEPPPPPSDLGEIDEPEVTIVKRGEDTVQEYRVRGRLYMVKVTPRHGVPYYLVDRVGKGQMVRDDNAYEMAVPMWVLQSW